jgi:hypothetical protein
MCLFQMKSFEAKRQSGLTVWALWSPSAMQAMQPEKTWFERSWEFREETLYPELFGTLSRGIFTLPPELFRAEFGLKDVDARWLHCGVLEYAPGAKRSSWLYVSSGLSNEWDRENPAPELVSGLGAEFVLETPERNEWAVPLLHRLMAFQLLLAGGRYQGKTPLGDFDRIPLGAPLASPDSQLHWLMLGPPTRFPRRALLESGHFDFTQIGGLSDAEAGFAREKGGSALLEELLTHLAWPLCNPARATIPLPGSS